MYKVGGRIISWFLSVSVASYWFPALQWFQLEETVSLVQRIEKTGVAAVAVHGRWTTSVTVHTLNCFFTVCETTWKKYFVCSHVKTQVKWSEYHKHVSDTFLLHVVTPVLHTSFRETPVSHSASLDSFYFIQLLMFVAAESDLLPWQQSPFIVRLF